MAENAGESLVKEYVAALGLWAVFVIGPRAEGPVKLRVGTDRTATIRDRKMGAEPIGTRGAIWFGSENFASACAADARLLSEAAGLRGPRAWLSIDVSRALEVIRAAAIAHEISFATDDSIAANAIASIEHIEKVFEQMRRDGGLQQLNTKYRIYRLKQNKAGRPVTPFPAWIREYKRRLIAIAAETSLQMNRASFGFIGDRSDTRDTAPRKLVSA